LRRDGDRSRTRRCRRRRGGIFTEGETGGGVEAERAPGVVLERGEDGKAVDIKRGLADAGLSQGFRGALEAVFGKGQPRRVSASS